MGAVYKATQISLDRPVAIKILPREFGQDAEFRTSFETEAKTMARLNHPNLIGVFDFGEVEGMLFIIMEFVPGKTLFHSAHGVAIAQDEAARIVIGVCEALAHAHEHGILHRDIKPGNILLDQQARPKIGDFGLARPIGAAVKDGETIFGTPHYTAPEVLKFPNAVDARADIFSIGVVFHELLTGKLPANDPRPASMISGSDPRFDAIIRRATHPSADLRYASAADMAKDIKAINVSGAAARSRAAIPVAVPGAVGPGRPQPFRGTVGVPAKSSGAGVVMGMLAIAAAIVVAILIMTKGHKSAPLPADPVPGTEVVDTPVTKPDPPKPKPEVKPEPKPEPEVVREDPKPEPEPEPEPEPMPEVVKKEDPTPVAPTPMPTFDVPVFLEKARAITRQRATPYLAEHAKELKKNLDAYERKVKREIRALEPTARRFVEGRAEESFTQWAADGNRIPSTLETLQGGGRGGRGQGGLAGGGRNEDKGFFDKLKGMHEDAYQLQLQIDEKLELNLTQLASTVYLLGLRKQIERLTDPNEVPSVERIKEEIDAVTSTPKYFAALMRGLDTEAAKQAAEGGDDKEKDRKKDDKNKDNDVADKEEGQVK